MNDAATWPWVAIAGLGAFHGVNPAMGWLFAVALGLQRGSRAEVARALGPIALGHAAAIAAAAVLVGVVSVAVPLWALRAAGGAALAAFGAWRLARGMRHRFRAGMAASWRDLAGWSFLMATAHGAGLMVVPPLLAMPICGGSAGLAGSVGMGAAAVALHTAAMLLVTGAVAFVVFDVVGIGVLRRGWVNLDLLWGGALMGVGVGYLALAA